MKTKTILISAAAAAALFAGSATSASAQPYWGGGYRSYGPSSYADYYRQLRACQRHNRVHRELDREHDYGHYEGLESRGDHRDQHDALDEAHEAYHYDNPRSDFCDRMNYSSRYRNPYGYGNPNYGSGFGFGFGTYGNGYGFNGYYGR